MLLLFYVQEELSILIRSLALAHSAVADNESHRQLGSKGAVANLVVSLLCDVALPRNRALFTLHVSFFFIFS